MQQPVDQQKAQQFAGKLVDIYAGCVLTQLVDVGYETGLFEAAARGPGTSHEIASRADLDERLRVINSWSWGAAVFTWRLTVELASFSPGINGRVVLAYVSADRRPRYPIDRPDSLVE